MRSASVYMEEEKENKNMEREKIQDSFEGNNARAPIAPMLCDLQLKEADDRLFWKNLETRFRFIKRSPHSKQNQWESYETVASSQHEDIACERSERENVKKPNEEKGELRAWRMNLIETGT